MVFTSDLWQIAAILCWIALGALPVLVLWFYNDLKNIENDRYFYDTLLDKPCWLYDKKSDTWIKHRIVAISHKGALNIRDWNNTSGTGAFWIRANEVPQRISFREK